MKICVVSDVHIVESDDSQAILFKNFLHHSVSNNANEIILLGDIFDLMVGPYQEYISKYQEIFSEILRVIEKGIKVVYVEGNHDFQIHDVWKTFKNNNGLDDKRFEFRTHLYEIKGPTQKIYFSHGDREEIENGIYPIYKKFITSKPLELLMKYVFSFSFVEKIGTSASRKSKDKNKLRYEMGTDNKESIKLKFRSSVDFLAKNVSHDLIVLGHSHVKDNYFLESGQRYLNNGYFPAEKTYIEIQFSDEKITNRFISLVES